jgi:hypothetical protein
MPVFPSIDCQYISNNVSAEYYLTLEERKQRVRNACGERLYTQLLALNVLDLELVGRAQTEVIRRFNLVPNHDQRLEQLHCELKTILAGSEHPLLRPNPDS